MLPFGERGIEATMKVTMLLADFAQVLQGKLYIMGGGWSITGPQPSLSAIALKIEVPWTQTNRRHDFALELIDADGRPVKVPGPNGEAPAVMTGHFEVGRPPGMAAGTPLDMPLALAIGPMPLAGGRYVWKLSIDGNSQDDWEVAFSVRATAADVPRTG